MIKTSFLSIIFLASISFFFHASTEACSNLSLINEQSSFHGQNYDWDVDTGLLIFNPSSRMKRGIGAQPATWVSKYSSLTFNQYGYEFPIGGMNDQGLTIGVMWLNETTFSIGESEKPIIEPLQWVQYQLDNFSNVDEVHEHINELEIRPVFGAASPLHFLVSDRDGKACVVTLKDGVTTIYVNETFPFPVLTNTPYDQCALEVMNYEGLGGNEPIPGSYGSVDRFVRASSFTQEFISQEDAEPSIIISYLDRLSQPNYTVWSIAYDKKNGRVSFKTNQNQNIRTVGFSDFINDCSIGAQFVDMNANGDGDISEDFKPLTGQQNLDLVRKSMAETTRVGLIPDKMLMNLAGYPFQLTCEVAAE